jgi:hypothetical protein
VIRARTWAAGALLWLPLLTACGSEPVAAPVPVSTTLVPATVLGGTLGVHLNTAAATEAAFRQGAKDSLIHDGRLWEVRRKDRLIGTLQIATVKPKVDLGEADNRDDFTSPILVGARSDIRLRGQEVSLVETEGGLSTLVWFGKGLFVVLQVKDTLVSGPDLAQEFITYLQSREEWEPLPDLYSPD